MPGKETGLGGAKQKAQHVETGRALHEHHARTTTMPQVIMMRAIQQPRADPREDEVARHLEQHVAEEEDAGAEAVDRGAEAQIVVHLQRGEPDVDAIEVATM